MADKYKHVDIDVTADPEDYIENCYEHEINGQYHRVGHECYTTDEKVLIKVTDNSWNKQFANKKAHKISRKSQRCFGEFDSMGKCVSYSVFYED